MSGDARDFSNMEMRAVIEFFFCLQGKAPKEIQAILTETLGEHAPSHATVKNCVVQFRRDDLVSLCLKANAEMVPKIPSCHYMLLM